MQTGSNFVVNKTTDTNDGTCSYAHCTLREAVNAANADADTSAITFDLAAFSTPKTIAVAGSGLTFKPERQHHRPHSRSDR